MIRFVIVAKPANEGGVLLYFSGDGFRPNLLQAARFRTEKDAQRRVRFSVICRRMIESGARIEFRRLSSAA